MFDVIVSYPCTPCRSVLTAAQLLSEGMASSPKGFAVGFDWAAEQLRQAGFEQLAAEVRPALHKT